MKIRERSLPKLRAAMMLAGMTMEDLAEEMCARSRNPGFPGDPIVLSQSSLSQRFQGRIPWKLVEAYLICDVLNIPFQEFPEYFFDKPDQEPPTKRRRGRPRKMPPPPPEEKIK